MALLGLSFLWVMTFDLELDELRAAWPLFSMGGDVCLELDGLRADWPSFSMGEDG
jgi:hypothetical protein